jgi:hypothetical protein
MKITISIMTWINRILMIPFLISLLISIIDSRYIFYTMYIAFAVGCFQIFSCLISLFYIKRIEKVKRNFLIIYMFLVAFYFLTWYLLDRFKLNNSSTFFIFYLFSIPVLLSIFWTYILELIKKKI